MADRLDKPSADWESMAPYWRQVDTILEGAAAMREAGQEYLPQFPNESDTDYEFRRKCAKFTNVYRDIVEGLASKPFSQELSIAEGAGNRILELVEDIDGRGNNMHVFAGETFFAGINRAIDWILVDYTRADGLSTVEDERAAGARPYWVHVPAHTVIDVKSDVMQGREQLILVKILQSPKNLLIYRRDGGKVTWESLEKNDKNEWIPIDGGEVTIGVIPLVPFITGRRKGSKWRFHPPMRDAADLQIELYQQETALKHIKTLTCFPMLAGNGVQPEVGGDGRPKPVPVGPQSVLYAPPNADGSHGEWKWIITDARTLTFLAEDIKETIRQLREIGRQPLTAQSGNLTKITTAVAAAKGNSAVQNWALQLKDALELAWKYTAMWLNESVEPEVKVFTDFGVDALEEQAPAWLIQMRQNGDISGTTFREEMKRYGVLSPEFDEDEEKTLLQDDILTGQLEP